jgi:ABC-type dipeptide/oligopeptide/nickel transport system permease component
VLSLVLRRAGHTLLVLVGVSVIVFALIHLTPGDPVDVIFAGENVTADRSRSTGSSWAWTGRSRPSTSTSPLTRRAATSGPPSAAGSR